MSFPHHSVIPAKAGAPSSIVTTSGRRDCDVWLIPVCPRAWRLVTNSSPARLCRVVARRLANKSGIRQTSYLKTYSAVAQR